jgi:hypothetical protein
LARKLATTGRTVARWEAAEALSPPILSRLHALAISAGAIHAAHFFERKLRESLDWKPDISEQAASDTPKEQAIPVTPDERALVSLVLNLYRANDKAIQPFVEYLLISSFADLTLEELRHERQRQQREQALGGLSSTSPAQTPAQALVNLLAPYCTPLSASGEQARETVIALLLRPRPAGEKAKE